MSEWKTGLRSDASRPAAGLRSFIASPVCSILAGLASLTALLLVYRFEPFHGLFWDARVYADAIERWRSGGDPYQAWSLLPFDYPPIFLLIASAIERVTGAAAGWGLYVALSVAAVFATVWMICRVYATRWWLTYPVGCAIFFAAPRLLGASTALGGNVNSLCAAAILAAGVQGLRQNRWMYFHIAVAAASCIKVSFLCYLLLPLLAAEGQAIAAAATVVTTAADYVVQLRTAPRLFGNFRRNLFQHAVLAHSDGFSVYSLVRRVVMKMHGTSGVALPATGHLVYCGIAVGMLAATRHRARPAANDINSLCLILVTAVTCNPRMMDYDAAVAIIPAAVLMVEGIASVRLRPLTIGLLACCLLLSLGVNAPMGILAILLSSALVGYLTIQNGAKRFPMRGTSAASEPA